jgi:hypothetical protein
VPAGTGSTQKQIEMIKDFGVKVMHCTPSYALYISETVRKMGIEPGTLPLKIGHQAPRPRLGAAPHVGGRNPLHGRLVPPAQRLVGADQALGRLPRVLREAVRRPAALSRPSRRSRMRSAIRKEKILLMGTLLASVTF